MLKYINKEKLMKQWNSRNICIEFPNGSDPLVQDGKYEEW